MMKKDGCVTILFNEQYLSDSFSRQHTWTLITLQLISFFTWGGSSFVKNKKGFSIGKQILSQVRVYYTNEVLKVVETVAGPFAGIPN